MKAPISRSEQNEAYTWNLDALYASADLFEQELQAFLKESPEVRWQPIVQFQGTLNQGPSQVKNALDLFFDIERKLNKLFTYTHLKHDEDLSEETWMQSYQKVTVLYQSFFQAVSWLEPELLALDKAQFETLLKDPSLELYRFYFQNLQHQKEHTLSQEKEELMTLASLPLSATSKAFNFFNNVDLPLGTVKDSEGVDHPLTHGNYRVYQRSPDRELRKNSSLQLHKSFMGFQNTLCELLVGHVQNHIFNVKARGYESSLMAALHPKNIPTKTYHNLIETVRSKAHLMHEYVKVKKQFHGYEDLHVYDLQIPFKETDQTEIPYEQAVEWIVESVAPLGEEYQRKLKEGLTEKGWVDVYENSHKRSGAYSSGCYDSHPYILMNYKGTLNDVFTLAHEAGHSMHTLYSQNNQPYIYARYPIFVAEVASVFNETLLMDYLLKKLDKPEQQWALLHEKLEEMRGTLFRQTLFAEFELFLHETLEANHPLTASVINEKYAQLNQDYYGPDLVFDKELSIEWARVPHFYSNFYVYQYATGISAALTLAYQVLEGKAGSKEAYLNFISQGGHQYPVDLLRTAGVDMESSEPILKALDVFEKLIDRLKILLNS